MVEIVVFTEGIQLFAYILHFFVNAAPDGAANSKTVTRLVKSFEFFEEVSTVAHDFS